MGVLEIALKVSFVMLLIALTLTFIRLVKGPSINDRMSSLDLLSIIVIGFVILYSTLTNKSIYIDVVIILSLVSFMGTVAIANYLKNKEK